MGKDQERTVQPNEGLVVKGTRRRGSNGEDLEMK